MDPNEARRGAFRLHGGGDVGPDHGGRRSPPDPVLPEVRGECYTCVHTGGYGPASLSKTPVPVRFQRGGLFRHPHRARLYTLSMFILLLVAAVILISSALVSMTEAALFSVPVSQVHLAVEKKRRGARRLLQIKKSSGRTVAAIVILNNAANIGGSIYVGLLADRVFGSTWIGVFSTVFTLLVILLAEIVPKTLGQKFATSISLWAAPLLTFATRLLLPLILLVEVVVAPVSRLRMPAVTAEEEIHALASLRRASGHISYHESELIRRAFRLNDISAKEIMTHRLHLTCLPAEKKLAEISAQEIRQMHSRVLVAREGDLDRIDGVVHQRDLLLAHAEQRTHLTLNDLKQPVPIVYEGTPAHQLLRQFQTTKQHLFLIVDEYGGTSGVVSLEDVLEELVGEIEDERDAEQPRPETAGTPAESPEPKAPTDSPGADVPPLFPSSVDPQGTGGPRGKIPHTSQRASRG